MTKYVKRPYPVVTQTGPAAQVRGLGCPGCGGECSRGRLGFVETFSTGTDAAGYTPESITGTSTTSGFDWKTAALIALAVLLLAQWFFGKDDRAARRLERKRKVKDAEEKYRETVRKIREGKA
jgi:hypothetical protein